MIKRACRAGVLGAAGALAEDMNETRLAGEETVKRIDEAFFEGAAAALGTGVFIEELGYRTSLETVFPVLIVCLEEGYTAICREVTAEGLIVRKTGSFTKYGKGKTLSSNNAECIAVIENVLEEKLRHIAGLTPLKGGLSVDLPEAAFDISVRVIERPAVIALALSPDITSGSYTASVYGAEIREDTALTGIITKGRKEVHYGECEKARLLIKEHTDTEYRFFNSAEEAASMGFYPAECCDPLGYYAARELHLFEHGR